MAHVCGELCINDLHSASCPTVQCACQIVIAFGHSKAPMRIGVASVSHMCLPISPSERITGSGRMWWSWCSQQACAPVSAAHLAKCALQTPTGVSAPTLATPSARCVPLPLAMYTASTHEAARPLSRMVRLRVHPSPSAGYRSQRPASTRYTASWCLAGALTFTLSSSLSTCPGS